MATEQDVIWTDHPWDELGEFFPIVVLSGDDMLVANGMLRLVIMLTEPN